MIYHFGNCALDADRRELWRGAVRIELQPQVFDVLLCLIQQRDRVVTKDELIAAVWKGRIVSDSTVNSRIALARNAIDDTGKAQRLIRTLSRVGHRFVGEVQEKVAARPVCQSPGCSDLADLELEGADSTAGSARLITQRPSLAIQPFRDISVARARHDFVSGIAEDITTALSQFPWLSVIARSSNVTHEGWELDFSQPERSVAARYILDGRLRKVGRSVRVTARLVDSATGNHLWAKRLDSRCEDVLGLQDDIATSVVGALLPRLEQLEIKRARQDPATQPEPVRYYLQGMGKLYQWNKDGLRDALALFQRAIELDPEFASAYGMAAYCYVQRKSYGWVSNREQENAESARLARQAVIFARDDVVALIKAAHAISSVAADIDSGAVFVDKALSLNSQLAAGWYVSGWIRLFLGQPDVAIEHLGRALSLGKSDPLIFKMYAAAGYAHFLNGRYDAAVDAGERVIQSWPYYLTGIRLTAASHACGGRLPHAQRLVARMREFDPTLRVGDLPTLIPFQRRVDIERWSDALWRAGLPE